MFRLDDSVQTSEFYRHLILPCSKPRANDQMSTKVRMLIKVNINII